MRSAETVRGCESTALSQEQMERDWKENGTSTETPHLSFLSHALSRDALLGSLTITPPRTSSVCTQPGPMLKPGF